MARSLPPPTPDAARRKAALKRAAALTGPPASLLSEAAGAPDEDPTILPSFLFIAYAREDLSLVETLVKDLRTSGIRVVWDQDFRAGENFRRRIDELIERAAAVLVVWSWASIGSEFVVDEAATAKHFDKLVAVRLPELPELALPLGFRGRHSVSVLDGDGIRKALANLGLGTPPGV
jgi:hypothetical protein